ncbi:MAG: hypothetical protein J6037_04395 [Bacteroidales bacterium]|nr:hypothetical protein [Bacteroidales bacterium]
MKRILTIAVLLIASLSAKAQQGIGKDIEFIDYLIGNNLTRDALAWMDGKNYAPSDTLDFLRGLTLYTANKLDLAADSFAKVPVNSPYYEQSLFFGAVSQAYLGNYGEGFKLIQSASDSELKQYELAAFSLLLNDRQAYEQAAQNFTYTDYSLTEGENIFGKIYESRYNERQKSPVLAGLMSAVIPGAGKFYAGRKDEGIASFFTVGIFAGLTAECWIKKGPKDWRTIVFGTLGSLFYIGNIYGSYMSVGIYNDNLRDAQNGTIVFNLHVPIRNLQ